MERVPPYTNEFLAYTAGFFDGEGCVYLTKSGKEYVLRVHITNTCRDVLQVFKEQFGGCISTSADENHPHWKTAYMWTLDYNHALDFLRLIEPWVGVKKDQLVLARFFAAVKNKDRTITRSDDYHELMTIIKDQMQWLNRKGKRLDSDIEPMGKLVASIPPEFLISEESSTCH